ncbi:MAG: hypothetical protein WDZ45_14370 [Flavobacteriaceae bacterium]
MKFNKIIFILSLLVFVACKQETKLNSDNELKEIIKKKVTSGQKSLDLRKITEFQWDSLIILTPYINYDKIETQFNTNLSQVRHTSIQSRDDISQLIFFKDGEPIKMIEYPRFPGDFATNKVEFIKRDNAKFDIVITNEKTIGGDYVIKLIKQE